MAFRPYTAVFKNVAITATQDMLALTATSSMAFRVTQIQLVQQTLTTFSGLSVSVIRLPATVTAGSGGSSVTPQKLINGDAAATVTARINDTTLTTTSGTASTLIEDQWDVIYPYLWVPAAIEQALIIPPSQALVVRLNTAPGSSMTASGTIFFEELY